MSSSGTVQLPNLIIPTLLAAGTLVASIATFRAWASRRPAPLQSQIPRGTLYDLEKRENGQVGKLSDLPDGRWTSPDVLEEEKRAIFSTMPLAVAHASMFQTAGSYRVIEHAAGFPLILVLGKDHVLRCFHNVCRHRAYPVISSNKAGCRPNLGCKYHGWTYNLSGKLIQAPKFENAEGFRKDQNSLFEVKTEIDDNGIVTVDLSSESKGNPVLDISKSSKGWMESWEVNGAFNWKVAECADAFKFPTLARNDGDVQARLGLAGKSKHVKPSILAEFVALPGHNAQLLMTIHPKTAETCTVHCTLFIASPSSASSLTLGSAKSDIAQCVSSLEKLYAKVKESDAM
ncbi:hypothetical protein G647_07842 [Cladophialophora carrionii CBS 160.54]|uniref:Rieske domain-containing protein n=1 Tax=Cladophialophora carrionii CBS 160.54 TaxID=1279043 RepID=V9D3Q5_9EURO|nr:uncharacterized protein G647_07842 [Cladophialophora carrionii CBS 160.54]ETI21495.1 hypothetical protein G647_07842 [Cladophialophora carrionii CBS 160.54]